MDVQLVLEIPWMIASIVTRKPIVGNYNLNMELISITIFKNYVISFINILEDRCLLGVLCSGGEHSNKEVIAAAISGTGANASYTEIVSRKQALKMVFDNQFKVEIISRSPEDNKITVYRFGLLGDLCRGPQIPNTAFVKAIAFLKASVAYWRENKDRESLHRVYDISYTDQKCLKAIDDYCNQMGQMVVGLLNWSQGTFASKINEGIVDQGDPDDHKREDRLCKVIVLTPCADAGVLEEQGSSLPCGHFFGADCIYRWLATSINSERYPLCNRSCTLADVRRISDNIPVVDQEEAMRSSMEGSIILAFQTSCKAMVRVNHTYRLSQAAQANVDMVGRKTSGFIVQLECNSEVDVICMR
ncbi:threonine--tRNA ligase, mitochondrial 1-like protein [Tanacetum coccineum]